MNSSQNEIVEKLIGGDAGDKKYTASEIETEFNKKLTANCISIINDFLNAKSKEDVNKVQLKLSKMKGGRNGCNDTYRNNTYEVLSKMKLKYKDQLPNIRVSKKNQLIQWKEEGDTSIEEEEETKTPQAPISAQTDKDKDVDLKDKVPKYVPNKETSKPVDVPKDTPKSPTDEIDEIDESDEKPITKEEEKKIEEFQAKHDINLKDKAFTELSNAKQLQENKNATADFQHEHALLNKAFKGMKRIEEIPFDKEKFERNLDAIQMTVNQIKKEAITDPNKINKMITPYITGVWKTAKGGKTKNQDLTYRISNEVRAAHRKYIKQKIDEILAQIDCHINITALDKKTKSGYKSEGQAKVTSGAARAAKYRELKGIKPQTVNDEETFFIYDNSHIDSIIEDFIQKRISKKYHMSDEAKSNINALINNETKTLRNTGSDKHGAEEVINSKFINELAKPIEEYINSKINRIAIAKSKKLSEDEKLQHMKKFKLSPVTKMKLEEILLRDTANLHPDSSNL